MEGAAPEAEAEAALRSFKAELAAARDSEMATQRRKPAPDMGVAEQIQQALDLIERPPDDDSDEAEGEALALPGTPDRPRRGMAGAALTRTVSRHFVSQLKRAVDITSNQPQASSVVAPLVLGGKRAVAAAEAAAGGAPGTPPVPNTWPAPGTPPLPLPADAEQLQREAEREATARAEAMEAEHWGPVERLRREAAEEERARAAEAARSQVGLLPGGEEAGQAGEEELLPTFRTTFGPGRLGVSFADRRSSSWPVVMRVSRGQLGSQQQVSRGCRLLSINDVDVGRLSLAEADEMVNTRPVRMVWRSPAAPQHGAEGATQPDGLAPEQLSPNRVAHSRNFIELPQVDAYDPLRTRKQLRPNEFAVTLPASRGESIGVVFGSAWPEVKAVTRSGVASRYAHAIQPGCRVISINGHPCEKVSMDEATRLCQIRWSCAVPNKAVQMVVRRGADNKTLLLEETDSTPKYSDDLVKGIRNHSLRRAESYRAGHGAGLTRTLSSVTITEDIDRVEEERKTQRMMMHAIEAGNYRLARALLDDEEGLSDVSDGDWDDSEDEDEKRQAKAARKQAKQSKKQAKQQAKLEKRKSKQLAKQAESDRENSRPPLLRRSAT